MGIGKHLYVGPYVECEYREGLTDVLVRGCPNEHCGLHPTHPGSHPAGEFCPKCGTRVGDVLVRVAVRPEPYDLIGEPLFEIHHARDHRSANVLYLALNEARPGRPVRGFDEDDDFVLDLRSVDQAAEMRWLEQAFAAELAKLRAAYVAVTVRWGLHQYFM